ncbi:YndM family protein [Planococcus sp. CP5-4]|uniref:DUF2512 family protein n=1 Tax=unclassified Planococcus (in: firmicutes) TaxID=2662419 RepID=UPI001C217022|nr:MULTISPECIES: DUF2512 family protein [unclassified Planococcus (in: firmicutes)]MBU9673746.1 YndM family protein [Planococcus sp. CP5-4_YE]MBV0908036.1 YndM family protein [Planococcus sp. CP5-4_UN]MBW6063203.1 YndM family protein [Planococcus sp. CP5-4]
MKHLIALAIKFVIITLVLLVILTWAFDVSFMNTLLISLALTALSYAIGDLLIFLNAGKSNHQTTRNTIATFADFIMALAVILLIGWLLTGEFASMVAPALVSALVLSAGEWFFHQYVDRSVVPWYNEYKSVKG